MLIDGVSRQQLRLMSMNALISAETLAGSSVFGWADWPTRPDLFPLLLVSAPRERRVSIFPGTLQFNTTITVVVVGRLVGPSPQPVGEGLELLSEQVTNALCLDPVMIRAVQQFNLIETQTVISAESKMHVGEISMSFDMIVYQDYGPVGVPLTDINITGTVVGGVGGTITPTAITLDLGFLQTT
jgi:hypothetical protein